MKQNILNLINKYKSEITERPLMDDYDGGYVSALNEVVRDLQETTGTTPKHWPQEEAGIDY